MQHILYFCGQDCIECVQVVAACVSMHSYSCVLSQLAGVHSHSLVSPLHTYSLFSPPIEICSWMPYVYLRVLSFLCPVSTCEFSFIASQMFTFSVCILVTASRWFGVYPCAITASRCPCISSSGWKLGPWTTRGPASSGSAPGAWSPASGWRHSCSSVAGRSGLGRPTERTWSPWFRETQTRGGGEGKSISHHSIVVMLFIREWWQWYLLFYFYLQCGTGTMKIEYKDDINSWYSLGHTRKWLSRDTRRLFVKYIWFEKLGDVVITHRVTSWTAGPWKLNKYFVLSPINIYITMSQITLEKANWIVLIPERHRRPIAHESTAYGGAACWLIRPHTRAKTSVLWLVGGREGAPPCWGSGSLSRTSCHDVAGGVAHLNTHAVRPRYLFFTTCSSGGPGVIPMTELLDLARCFAAWESPQSSLTLLAKQQHGKSNKWKAYKRVPSTHCEGTTLCAATSRLFIPLRCTV